MTRIATVLVVLAVAACEDEATSRPIVWATTKPLIGPDGSRHWFVECRTNIGYCYEVAGKQCPRGYDVLDRGAQSGEIATTEGEVQRTSRSTAATHERTTVTPTFRGSMLIRCKAPGVAAVPSVAPAANSPQPAGSSSAAISRDTPF